MSAKVRVRFFRAAAALLLAVTPLADSPEAPAALAQRAEERVRGAGTLYLRITQRYSMEGWLMRSEPAEVWFSRAGKLNWVYTGPEAKRFVLDGGRSWFYLPSQNTVYAAPVKDAMRANPLLAFLLKKRELGGAYDFEAVEQNGAQWVLRGTPRKLEDKLIPFLLYVDSESAAIRKAAYLDDAGGLTEILVEETVLNPEIPERMFRFDMPEGAELIQGAMPAGE